MSKKCSSSLHNSMYHRAAFIYPEMYNDPISGNNMSIQYCNRSDGSLRGESIR